MSETDIKFGPEWMRQISSGSSDRVTGVGGMVPGRGGGTNSITSAPNTGGSNRVRVSQLMTLFSDECSVPTEQAVDLLLGLQDLEQAEYF